MSIAKGPSAVVLLTRGDRVLGLTRGPKAWHDWHLPGGKWEPIDGWQRYGSFTPSGLVEEQGEPDLRETAIRELREETRVAYVTRSGRPVQAFRGEAPDWIPEHLGPTEAGQPAWVPPGMLLQPWCSFGPECRIVLTAAGLVDG